MLIKIDFDSSEAIYLQLRNQVIMGIVVANGVPEAIVAAVLTLALGKVLLHFNFNR